jgi:hypothetical protein
MRAFNISYFFAVQQPFVKLDNHKDKQWQGRLLWHLYGGVRHVTHIN